MSDSPYSSPLAASLGPGVRDRLLRYAAVGTTADPTNADARPSSPGQLELSRMLATECEALGLADVSCDDQGYVMATVPASAGAEGLPTVGLIAHVDTSPDAPGSDVKPLLHEAYDGGEIVLPAGAVLDPEAMPTLRELVDHDLITSSGDTLLGADDKAGIAVIMTAAAHLIADPSLPRPALRLGFGVDEEIGRGAYDFPLERFGAQCAYTIDGGDLGEFSDETFSAAGIVATFTGVDIHPSVGKGKLVNALRVASDFVARLPRDLAPETTDGRDGFLHPTGITGGSGRAVVEVIARDFEDALLDGHVALARAAAEDAVAAYPGSSVEVVSGPQYPNMRRFLDGERDVSARALQAIRAEGLEPVQFPVRGGTDGSILSSRGLPTPNIFTGSGEHHSVREWASVPWMAAAAAVVVHLAGLWATA